MPSIGLGLYRMFSHMGEGFGRRALNKRLGLGKEDPERVAERMGIAGRPRPDGPLVWFHAASVGESLSVLDLIRRIELRWPELRVLVTTGTVTSAQLMASRLPENAIHQFYPLDFAQPVRSFLDHWQPDLVLWTESEFWPTMLAEVKRCKVPLILLNARMSERSAKTWRWAPAAAKRIVRSFDIIMTQDQATRDRLLRMGALPDCVEVTGSLKDSAAPLPHDDVERKRLNARLGATPVWCAASTHRGEETIVAQAHRLARRSAPGLALILVPRHPERGPEVASMLESDGWRVGLRSRGDDIQESDEIYVADTLGELGLWYRLCPVSMVGGSLVAIGGHNPFEPAALGSAIVHGPHIANFEDAYRQLHKAGAAVEVTGAADLAAAISDLVRPDRAATMATAAWDLSSAGAGTLDRVLSLLSPVVAEAVKR
ncbi:3-deoxy-D-manno-octulosonic-acid transferase [Monaibacterium marinum]|uniref:3-deoxy-D-manno-octulosonic acid transferase n=1 Tax=Pontivivens marinum TaxID=1690039 RepID=A0A2C9CN57_9RHOB|nr:3-deoxy-D-manno-octulosonic acid transferase [Monaibacterium marinum]SOH92826.1 3-deoxy-D-manno-octulosonic-acid transferase [Monaibacterium marinum]